MFLTREEYETRKEFLEFCYANFCRVFELEYIDGYVQKILDFYCNEILVKIKTEMAEPEHRIDIHKIISGTILSILTGLIVKPKTDLTITNWGQHREVILVNLKFAIFVSTFILVKTGIPFQDLVFVQFTKKYAFTQFKTLLYNITKTIHKNNRVIDYNYFFLLSYNFFLAEKLLRITSVQDNLLADSIEK